jgi:hypothetical protein
MRFLTFRRADAQGGPVRAGVLQGDGAGYADTVPDLAHPALRDALARTVPEVSAPLRAGLADAARRIRRGAVPARQSHAAAAVAALLLLANYLDRVNVSFTALQMNQSPRHVAAGLWVRCRRLDPGYVAFEVPSNLLLYRVGRAGGLS